jgi:hypothetical protein
MLQRAALPGGAMVADLDSEVVACRGPGVPRYSSGALGALLHTTLGGLCQQQECRAGDWPVASIALRLVMTAAAFDPACGSCSIPMVQMLLVCNETLKDNKHEAHAPRQHEAHVPRQHEAHVPRQRFCMHMHTSCGPYCTEP